MLYRQRSAGSTRVVAVMILMGILAGGLFFFIDNISNNEAPLAPLPTPTAFHTPTPVASPIPVTSVASIPALEATLFIPTAGISTPIIETFLRDGTWDVSNLGTNAGHLQGTPWVTEPGNVVLSGHVEMSDGQQGIFANLEDLQIGELIVIRDGETEYRYTITEKFSVQPDDLSVLYPTATERLTLITCSDYNFIRDVYEERYVVVAERLTSS